jgi:L-fuconolactonase
MIAIDEPVQACAEPIMEPDLPIVDAHHHLFLRHKPPADAFADLPAGPWREFLQTNTIYRYLLDEFLADINSGHNIRATVFLDSRTMYRLDGPEAMKSVGEVEFANGVAAMAASGKLGSCKVCAGIIGDVLSIDEHMEAILGAHIRAGGDRYRSLHFNAHYDSDPQLPRIASAPGLLLDKSFREGYRLLQRHGLAFDVNLWEPQLPDLIDLARSFPETQIVLNHIAGPLGIGGYAGKGAERFPIWRKNMALLAACNNVAVKLGALASYPFYGFKSFRAPRRATSEELADEWRPYIEPCIELFGAERCMFESDAPSHKSTCSYAVLWNVFKRLAAGGSREEKTALFSGTASRIYRLAI